MKNRKIILGVTGGIAAYKSVEVLRLLVKEGADVQVVMTQAAQEFVTPLTFAALSSKSVLCGMFDHEGRIPHIELAQSADLIMVAPATADFIARSAGGRASDLLGCIILASRAPVLYAPAMNDQMWTNPLTQWNVETLGSTGVFYMVQPSTGDLACGSHGPGRMADPDLIIKHAAKLLKKDLGGKRIMVTAGPTNEALDPVRFIGNRSSGKMGYAIAEAAYGRGASVTLVSGPVGLSAPDGVDIINVTSALDMRKAVLAEGLKHDAVIMAAAVADYRPEKVNKSKMKKSGEKISIELVKNPDILIDLKKKRGRKKKPVFVGFAVETQNLIKSGFQKLKNKGCAFVVANHASVAFGGERNEALIIGSDGKSTKTGNISKRDLANLILDRLRRVLS